MPLISHTTYSARLPFFQKATAIVVIVDFGYRTEGRGEFEHLSKHPFTNFASKCVQKVGGVFWGASLQDMFFHKTGNDKLLDKAKSSRLSLVHSIVVVYTDTEENNGSCT